ncbi:MAG: adenylate/guanylate cyclase domain-containing protein, partial [Bacteroidota bacterium]
LIPKTPKYKKTISKDYRLMGFCEEKNGQDQSAVKSYQAGVRYAIESKNRFEYAWGMYQVGQLQNKLGDHATAVGALDKAIEQAQKLDLNNLVRNADRIRNASMAVLETKLEKEEIENEVKVAQQEIENAQQKIEEQQEFAEALVTEKELAEMERDAKIAEIELKAKELDKLELQNALIEAEKTKIEAEQQAQLERQEKEEERYILIGIAGGVVFLLTVLFMFGRIRSRRKHAKAIEEEKQKSEKLLYDVLPESIAKEILMSGKVRAKGYDEVSILFTDFKGFTKIAASLSPEKLVKDLDYAFEHFDQIVRKYGLEKIKTIGDAYMAAAGIPDKSKDHALDAVGVALEMQAFMQRWRTEKLRKAETPWELRIGINSGPVVAGVIGQHKFAYDIWGDAVNMASRMESSGEPGKINISARTQELIGKVANTSYRGKIEVKNAGAVDMYFVNDLLVKKNFQATTPKPQKKPWWRR